MFVPNQKTSIEFSYEFRLANVRGDFIRDRYVLVAMGKLMFLNFQDTTHRNGYNWDGMMESEMIRLQTVQPRLYGRLYICTEV